MFPYNSPQLGRLLIEERLREAARTRLVRDRDDGCALESRRSILTLFRRRAILASGC